MPRTSKDHAVELHEAEKMIEVSEGDQKAMVTILVFTGLRVSELANMESSWVKWQEGIIQVPSFTEGGWKPKSKAGARKIPILDKRLEAALQTYFYANKRVKYHRVTIWEMVKRAAGKAGIQHKVYPHALRATFANFLAYKGIGTSSIKHVMGWSKIETAEHYIASSGAAAVEEIRRKWK